MDLAAVLHSLAAAESCSALLASLGVPANVFLSYLVIRKLQTIGLALGPLHHIGWGARSVAAERLGFSESTAQLRLACGSHSETAMVEALAAMVEPAQWLIALHIPGWEKLFSFCDVQHCCCEPLGALTSLVGKTHLAQTPCFLQPPFFTG